MNRVLIHLFILLLVVSNCIAQVKSKPKPKVFRGYRKEHLGMKVNSPYSELSPIISPDGRYLYFTMGIGNPRNIGDAKLQDAYISTLESDGSWSYPKNLGLPINSAGNDAISSVSPDGSVLFIKNFAQNHTSGFCFARKKEKAWQIDSITVEQYYNNNKLSTQCISNYGEYIIMSLERSDGYGGLDLYVSKRKDREHNIYGPPDNLGPVINTSENDFAPFLSSDGKTMYFSSSGRGGSGSADVFKSKLLDDSWVNWTTPQNLGTSINTSGLDAYYSIPASGDVAYFSSSNGMEQLDLFRIRLMPDQRPDPVILLKGRITDKKGRPIQAQIISTDIVKNMETANAISNSDSGDFSLILPAGDHYRIRAEADGYLSFSDDLDFSEAKGFEEPYITIQLDKIAVGSATVLGDIFFDFNEATLKPASFYTLDKQADLLKRNPKWKVNIEGYTDSIGEAEFNQELSEKRAKSVVDYLVQKGVVAKRLHAVGKGEKMPIAPNDTEEGRRKNRRVMFRITKID